MWIRGCKKQMNSLKVKKKKKTQKRACGSAGGELERSRERGRGGESARSVYSLDF